MEESYIILQADTVEQLQEIVNQHIKNKYKPKGGVGFDSISVSFIQAVYKAPGPLVPRRMRTIG